MPTEKDRTDPEYLAKYWPNFVCAVEEALQRAKIDCRISVAGRTPDRKQETTERRRFLRAVTGMRYSSDLLPQRAEGDT